MNHIHWEDLSWIENFVLDFTYLATIQWISRDGGTYGGGAPPKLKSIHLDRKEGMKGGREERRE